MTRFSCLHVQRLRTDSRLRVLLCSSFSTQSIDPCRTVEEFDVVIIGGGMVGAAVACGLASNKLASSLRVAVVDSKPVLEAVKASSSVPDPRVSALTPSTVEFLKEVGAWNYIKSSRHAPFHSMQVWDYTGYGYTRYNAADVGKEVLGYVVENNVILSALHSKLKELGCATIISPASTKSVVFPARHAHNVSESVQCGGTDLREHGFAKVELDNGQCLYTRLVVAADGSNSKVRALAGLQTFRRQYGQEAVVCTLETEKTHSTAWQRFLPTGPLAILPMGDNFSNIVWSTSPEQAHDLKNTSEEEFVANVNEALVGKYGSFPSSMISELLGETVGSLFDSVPSCSEPFQPPPKITNCLSKRASFPLSLTHAYKYVLHRLVLVGDAAHSVHPLAGQGVNLGFGDAAALVKVLSSGIEVGADIGEVSLLEKYERQQQLANVPMMAILDGFQRVFSVDFGPINAVRAAAFRAVQLISPLKKQVISYATGEGGFLKLNIFGVRTEWYVGDWLQLALRNSKGSRKEMVIGGEKNGSNGCHNYRILKQLHSSKLSMMYCRLQIKIS